MTKQRRTSAGEIPKTYNERMLEAQRKPRPRRAPGHAEMMKPGDDQFDLKPEKPRPFDKKKRGA